MGPGHSSSSPLDGPDDHRLLAEQRTYYRKRAPEYDEWWQRIGRYDRGEEQARQWDEQVGEIAATLKRFGPTGDVLELAGGTGWWTERLAETAGTLTVVDASPETLEINRRRPGGRPGLSYVVGDLFEWQPGRSYDVVFFSFWLSHVPRARFHRFWDLVRDCLAPGGRVFLIDNRRDPTLTFVDYHVLEESDEVQRRTLNDGSEHRLVKILNEPDELVGRLEVEGWDAQVVGSRWFIYGSAHPVAKGRTDGHGR